jgi:Bacterial regulatory proteins, tetR family
MGAGAVSRLQTQRDVVTGSNPVRPTPREIAARSTSAIFTEQGYDATTVAQIGERAGVTKSTFFPALSRQA